MEGVTRSRRKRRITKTMGLLVAAAAVLTLLVPAGPSGATHTDDSEEVVCDEFENCYFLTELKVNQAAAKLLADENYVKLKLSGVLKTDAGHRIAGVPLEFRVGGQLICTKITGPGGAASCGGVMETVDVALSGFRYSIRYDGGDEFTPPGYEFSLPLVSAQKAGQLAQVGALKLFK